MNPTAADDLAVTLAADRAAAELDLVASILCDPARCMPAAERAGATADDLDHEDIRIIFIAADVARHKPLADVLRLARRGLQHVRHWNPAGPIGTGSQWSDETLVALATSWPPCPTVAAANARKLLALAERQRAADAAYHAYLAALSGTGAEGLITPSVAPAAAPRGLVMLPVKLARKRGAA